jgi:hypothetical protein
MDYTLKTEISSKREKERIDKDKWKFISLENNMELHRKKKRGKRLKFLLTLFLSLFERRFFFQKNNKIDPSNKSA